MGQFAKIIATASYTPDNVVTNDDLSQILDTNDEWIYSRTGIKERHISTGQDTSDLCIKVAKNLLDESGLDASDIDFIIVASMTPDYQSPSTACIVQGAIEAKNAWALDVSAACSGFVYALTVAEKMISGSNKRGVVIAGDVMSKAVDWSDRSTAVLFGDGAGGVILESSQKQHILSSNLYAQGEKANCLQSGKSPVINPWIKSDSSSKENSLEKLSMNGRQIFSFVVGNVSKTIKEYSEQIDYYLLHQANARILDQVSKKIGQPREKFLQNIEKYGNTSSASVAILLDEAIKNEILTIGSGQQILLSAFGGGLTWGNILIKL